MRWHTNLILSLSSLLVLSSITAIKASEINRSLVIGSDNSYVGGVHSAKGRLVPTGGAVGPAAPKAKPNPKPSIVEQIRNSYVHEATSAMARVSFVPVEAAVPPRPDRDAALSALRLDPDLPLRRALPFGLLPATDSAPRATVDTPAGQGRIRPVRLQGDHQAALTPLMAYDASAIRLTLLRQADRFGWQGRVAGDRPGSGLTSRGVNALITGDPTAALGKLSELNASYDQSSGGRVDPDRLVGRLASAVFVQQMAGSLGLGFGGAELSPGVGSPHGWLSAANVIGTLDLPWLRGDAERGLGVWASLFGARGGEAAPTQGAKAGFAALGGSVGISYRASQSLLLSAFAGFSAARLAGGDGAPGRKLGEKMAGVVASYDDGRLSGTVSFGPTADGSLIGTVTAAYSWAAMDWQIGDWAIPVAPFVDLRAVTIQAASPTRASPGRQVVASGTAARAVIGAQIDRRMSLLGWFPVESRLRVGYARDLVGRPSGGGSAQGAVIGLTLTSAVDAGGRGFLRYDGDLSRRVAEHAVSGGVRWSW